MINAVNNRGHTALHLAVMNDHIDVVEVLLRYGADRYIEDADGKIPQDHAAQGSLMHNLLD